MNAQQLQDETLLARSVAAEDLRRGDFVAVLNEVREYPSFLWHCDAHVNPPEQPVRVQWQSFDKGLPLRVMDVCLPFVFVKRPSGRHQTLDVRRCQLVRLDRRYAKRVRKALGRRSKRLAKKRWRKSGKL